MFRVRKIDDAVTPANARAIGEIQKIMQAQFPGLPTSDVEKLPKQISDPFTHEFVTEVWAAEDASGHVQAFATVQVDPQLKFAYLELISAAPGGSGRGLGAVLYEGVRDHARGRGLKGLFFECLPDDPALSPDAKVRAQNARRLKFYERYGARPIAGTLYETPVTEGTTDSPYLVFDGLGAHSLPKGAVLKDIVRAVLERKYPDHCPPGYVEKVIGSIRDGGFSLRPARYSAKPSEAAAPAASDPAAIKIPLVVNDRHDIHHVKERGYVQAPVRVGSILSELQKADLFARIEPKSFGDRHIRAVHDSRLVDYIEKACAEAPDGVSVYPYVFPVRNASRRPKDRSVLAGYWCIDTFTPLNRSAYPAARRAVDCALTAAERVKDGAPLAYALVRPPGHHAERRAFGGFCYFNNSAIAAHYLSQTGRVAVLDVDYHHGNGTQDIFYERADVLTVSVHGHPSFAYPYFTGFRDETGRGAGAGCNLNMPLPEATSPEEHRGAVRTALKRIARHEPAFLVVALGLDVAKGDPTGTWNYTAADFRALGRMVGEAGWPTLVVQEGGYRVRTLGVNARNFFTGLAEGAASPKPLAPRGKRKAETSIALEQVEWREAVRESDAAAVRRLVTDTGMFTTAEIAIAAELVEERVGKGRLSGYEFVFAEAEGELLGYACYGPTPGTDITFDLYWIAVAPARGGRGLGKALMARVEQDVAQRGGLALYADTSGSERYEPTRSYYRNVGFKKVAELPDFYRLGDSKVIYRKEIARSASSAPDATVGGASTPTPVTSPAPHK
jgi:acetoin utilization deacetylase AcuC-like enzyme/GNAT superfamily N-acetyltransferase